jgi:NifU-like protein involved in Fe-S cluster formation
VNELFERGFRRNRLPPLSIEGMACASADDFSARFSLAVRDGTITDIRFRATVCATLVAYCELAAELAAGQPLDAVRAVSALSLVSALPGVPALKRDRAVLTAAAFRAALAAADSFALNRPGATDEGRLHLRHATP